MSEREFFLKAKREAAREARRLLRREFIVIDSETTGLESEDRMVSIGITDHQGNVLLDTLINPLRPVDATWIHGITDEMVADAPTFADIWPAVYDALEGRCWVGYNVSFDWGFITRECERITRLAPPPALKDWEGGPHWWRRDDTHDVMRMFAEFYGEFHDYHQSFTWKKLIVACEYLGIEIKQAHHAAHDALATLAVLRGMAQYD
jgi:DNA polymerase III subunit epsilon